MDRIFHKEYNARIRRTKNGIFNGSSDTSGNDCDLKNNRLELYNCTKPKWNLFIGIEDMIKRSVDFYKVACNLKIRIVYSRDLCISEELWEYPQHVVPQADSIDAGPNTGHDIVSHFTEEGNRFDKAIESDTIFIEREEKLFQCSTTFSFLSTMDPQVAAGWIFIG